MFYKCSILEPNNQESFPSTSLGDICSLADPPHAQSIGGKIEGEGKVNSVLQVTYCFRSSAFERVPLAEGAKLTS